MKRKASVAKNNGHAKFGPFFYVFHLMNISADCCCNFFSGYIRRARKKRVSEDSDEDSDGAGGDEDSDVEMADVSAYRKSDASETNEKQTRASRLSARTRAKVCLFYLLCASGRLGQSLLNHLT